jgi:hypothetical protein
VTSGDGQELARCPMTGITFSPTERTLWLKNSDAEDSRRQRHAAVDALIGIKPADELEGMIASQLLAAQNAAMECYRRAMIGDQTFEGRRENLSQADKLSRTYAVLLDTLNWHRQGPAEGYGGARSRPRRWSGGGWQCRNRRGRGPSEIRGSSSRKANWLMHLSLG